MCTITKANNQIVAVLLKHGIRGGAVVPHVNGGNGYFWLKCFGSKMQAETVALALNGTVQTIEKEWFEVRVNVENYELA